VNSPSHLATALKASLEERHQLPARRLLAHAPFSSKWMLNQCQNLYQETLDAYKN
jgi:hypothetical protein